MLVLVSYYYILFYYSWEACLSSNDRKGVDLNGREGVEELGEVEGYTGYNMWVKGIYFNNRTKSIYNVGLKVINLFVLLN